MSTFRCYSKLSRNDLLAHDTRAVLAQDYSCILQSMFYELVSAFHVVQSNIVRHSVS
jgi:hypothetical protein